MMPIRPGSDYTTDKRVKLWLPPGAALGKGQATAPEKPDPHFKPTPGKRIRFADGVTMNLNRKERRARHIYNRDLKRI